MNNKKYVVTCKYELVVECSSKKTAISIAKEKTPYLHGSRFCSDKKLSGIWDSTGKIEVLSCVHKEN